VKVLVSACLLGLACRYDGGAATDETVTELTGEHTLVPFCPEIYGGLPTPREPAEIRGGPRGDAFRRGRDRSLRKGRARGDARRAELGCECALLQDRSPSCGGSGIHDGSFTGALVPGDGVTAKLLGANGVRVLPASRAGELRGGKRR
jgi:uncharacterized protein YbbK (DUF523 family)